MDGVSWQHWMIINVGLQERWWSHWKGPWLVSGRSWEHWPTGAGGHQDLGVDGWQTGDSYQYRSESLVKVSIHHHDQHHYCYFKNCDFTGCIRVLQTSEFTFAFPNFTWSCMCREPTLMRRMSTDKQFCQVNLFCLQLFPVVAVAVCLLSLYMPKKCCLSFHFRKWKAQKVLSFQFRKWKARIL